MKRKMKLLTAITIMAVLSVAAIGIIADSDESDAWDGYLVPHNVSPGEEFTIEYLPGMFNIVEGNPALYTTWNTNYGWATATIKYLDIPFLPAGLSTLLIFEGIAPTTPGTYYVSYDTGVIDNFWRAGDTMPLTVTNDDRITISFNSNGGVGTVPSQVIMPGVSIDLPVEGCTKSGYYLSGWLLGSTEGVKQKLGASFTMSGDTTLYAEWTPLPSGYDPKAPAYGVVGKLYAYGPSMSMDPYLIYNKILTPKFAEFTWEKKPSWLNATIDYNSHTIRFSGVPSAPGVFEVSFYMKNLQGGQVEGSYISWIITVAPRDSLTLYQLTYSANGGSGIIPNHTGIMPNNAVELASGGFTREGYTLVGWETTVSGSTAVFFLGSSFTVSANTTLKAHWVANSNIVVLNANGGVGNVDPYIAYSDGHITLPTSGFTRQGYTLEGWFLSDDTSAIYPKGYIYTPSDYVTFYAYWLPSSASTSTVTINANGGTGGYTQKVETGKKIVLPISGINKSGSTLVGWADSSTATSSVYSKGDKVTINSSVTIYAYWGAQASYVTVSFNLNNGIGSIQPQTIAINTAATQPNDPTRPAHIFTGWKISGGDAWSDWSAPVTTDMTLVAQWELHFSLTMEGTMVHMIINGPYAGASQIIWGDGTVENVMTGFISHDYQNSWSGTITVTSTILGVQHISSLPYAVNGDDTGGDDGGDDGGDEENDNSNKTNWALIVAIALGIIVGLFLIYLYPFGLIFWTPIIAIIVWWLM